MPKNFKSYEAKNSPKSNINSGWINIDNRRLSDLFLYG